MHGSDRGIIATIVGCLVLAAVGLADSKQREYEAHRARDLTKRIEQIDTNRAGVPRWAEAFISNPDPSNGTARENRDLAAQEASATWAFWVAIFAAVQTVLTVVGIYFIKRTLDATLEAVEDTGLATKAMNDANEIARMAYNASVRPWLSLNADMAFNYLSWLEDGSAGVFVDATARNYGKSPATNVNFLIRVDVADFAGDYGFDNNQFFEKCCEELRFATESSVGGETIFSENDFQYRSGDNMTFEQVERSFRRLSDGHDWSGFAQFSAIYPVVFIGCGYNSQYDSETRITAFMANVMQFQNGVGNPILFRRNEYSRDLLLYPKVKGCARLD